MPYPKRQRSKLHEPTLNEKQITKGIISLLNSLNWYTIKTHTPGQYATQPGVSDLIAISPHDKTVAFIEVKGPRGKPNQQQLAFLANMRDRGHIAFVATSIDSVIRKLKLPVLL